MPISVVSWLAPADPPPTSKPLTWNELVVFAPSDPGHTMPYACLLSLIRALDQPVTSSWCSQKAVSNAIDIDPRAVISDRPHPIVAGPEGRRACAVQVSARLRMAWVEVLRARSGRTLSVDVRASINAWVDILRRPVSGGAWRASEAQALPWK